MVTKEEWQRYDRWNEAVMRCFFDGRWAHQPVYLDLEDHVVQEMANLASESGSNPGEAFVAAARSTLNPRPDYSSPLLGEHCRRTTRWKRSGRRGTPPFLAVLALLSFVAEQMRADEEFRASNYYGRLCSTLGCSSDEPGALQKVQRGIMEDSHTLWEALNSWLDAHEGKLGIPTAFAFDYRVHVGIPISQALVREADRKALREMFADLRLRPGQSLSRSDMARLLASWLPTAPVSSSLARLAKHREALERVGDVACIELQAWDGRAPGAAGLDHADAAVAAGNLGLAAALRRQPRPKLDLYLLARGVRVAEPTNFVPTNELSSHAAAALEPAGGMLRVGPPDDAGWSVVENSPLVSLPDVLFTRLELEGGCSKLSRDPRRLVVLEYDEEWRRYTEVARAQLGHDNLLLCHESLRAQVDQALGVVARPGFTTHEPGSLPGVPEGWIAYSKVEVMGILNATLPDLSPLVPLSWSQVALGGGFVLPGRTTWLAANAPEARLSSFATGELEVRLVCASAADQEPRVLGGLKGAGVFPLNRLGLADGDYRIILVETKSGGSVIASQALHLRSPDSPRAEGEEELLGHAIGTGWGGISAEPILAEAESARGAAVAGQGGEVAASTVPPLTLGIGALDNDRDLSVAADVELPTAHGGEAPTCLLGGAHHWLLEDARRGASRWRDVGGVCKHCGLEKYFPARPGGRAKRARKGPAERLATEPQTAIGDVSRIASEREADYNELLAGLCYARAGSWGAFVRLAQQVSDDPWFALEAARTLSALGHLDLELEGTSLRPQRWQIAPTILAVHPSGDAATLCGRRSAHIVRALRDAGAACGAHINEETQQNGPDRILISGLTGDGFYGLADGASTEDAPISAELSAMALAAALPSLQSIADALPILDRVLDAPLQRFDFERNSWRPCSEITDVGAYRFTRRPYTNVAVTGSVRQPVVCDNRLVKWLGASAIGLRLVAYNREDRSLRTPLGAQLPGLYERAAVLCSGCVPAQLTDGTVGYRDVPPEVASAIWTAATNLSPLAAGR